MFCNYPWLLSTFFAHLPLKEDTYPAPTEVSDYRKLLGLSEENYSLQST
jgi:hypothetical protein